MWQRKQQVDNGPGPMHKLSRIRILPAFILRKFPIPKLVPVEKVDDNDAERETARKVFLNDTLHLWLKAQKDENRCTQKNGIEFKILHQLGTLACKINHNTSALLLYRSLLCQSPRAYTARQKITGANKEMK